MKCKFHKINLIESKAFRFHGELSPLDEQLEIMKKYPNSISFDCCLWEDDFYTKPVILKYCPKCEQTARYMRMINDVKNH